jgi:hypothetical protein
MSLVRNRQIVMNTHHNNFLERELGRLSDQDSKKTEFCISVSANMEKLTNNQQALSKRLDDINEKQVTSDKRILTLEQDKIKREERTNFVKFLIKLWPLYLGLTIAAFSLGVIVNDLTVVKALFFK